MRVFIVSLLAFCASCTPIPKRLVLAPKAINNLYFLHDNLKVEYAFCAYGVATKNVLWVQRVELAFINSATDHTVNYDACEGDHLLGYGHSHVDGPCQFSGIDVGTLVTSPPPFGFLVCSDQRFSWYSKREVIRDLKEK